MTKTITIRDFNEFKKGDKILSRGEVVATMTGRKDSDSIWQFVDSHSLTYISPSVMDLILPVDVEREFDIEVKPEHQVKNFKWGFCYLTCNGPFVYCPRCDANSCGCGCQLEGRPAGDCPEQEWWDAQNGEEYEKEHRKRMRPDKQELIEYAKELSAKNLLNDPLRWKVDVYDMQTIIDHLAWHGVNFEFITNGDNWTLNILD